MNYLLKIEELREHDTYRTASYYTKGHHDKKKFIEAVKDYCDLEFKVENVSHTHGKLATDFIEGGQILVFKKCKGSFPITIVDVR